MATGRHVFIGGRDRGLAWLRWLADRGQLPLAVYCLLEDDHEAEKFSPEIVRFCEEHGVPCRPRKKLRREDEAELERLAPDLTVVMGWRTLVSDRVLAAARFGAVGLHESLLPVYRGFAPVNWAVINGETETGVSLFYMTNTGIDDGDVVAQARVPIGANDTAGEVYARTAAASLDLLKANLDRLLDGTAPRAKQDESRASYTCSRTPADGLIDWTASTRTIHNLIRGLSRPYPGAFTHHAGELLRVWRAEPVAAAPAYVGRVPGRVVRVAKGEGFVEVLTGDGVLRVHEVEPAGGSAVAAAEAVTSVRTTLGLGPVALADRVRLLEAELAETRKRDEPVELEIR